MGKGMNIIYSVEKNPLFSFFHNVFRSHLPESHSNTGLHGERFNAFPHNLDF